MNPKPDTKRGLRNLIEGISPTHLSALMALALSAISALLGLTLSMSHRDTQRNAEQTIANIASVLAQDIERTFQSLDLSLQAAVDGWRSPELAGLSPGLKRMVLFDRSATKQETGSIAIADASGQIVLDAQSETPRKANLADREFFRVHRDQPETGLVISDPLVSRLSGEWLLSLSRRLDNPDGTFGGVVTASVRLGYFRTMFERVSLGEKGSIALLSTQGKTVLRTPFDQNLVGKAISDQSILRYAEEQPSGLYRATSRFDGEDRLHAFQRVGAFPFIQNVALSRDDVFSAWWGKAAVVILVFVGLSAAVAFLTMIFVLELRRRTRAEAELALAARTDALTGLGNRRRFDDGLHYEWRRARPTRQNTALLIVDVDHFKSFNDTYGHVAGDVALARVAGCIRQSLRAPADVGTRYGGEEFALILPNTTMTKAARIAAGLQKAVAALQIDHRGSAHGILTISIGVAAGSCQSLPSESDLIRSADAALYRAKKAGRNRVAEMAAPETVTLDRAA